MADLVAPAQPVDRLVRPESRRFVGLLVISTATALLFGFTLKTPSMFEANDISRWCTVWSLLERGTYAIDDCPWQSRTQDKVKRSDKLEPPAAGASRLKQLEYQLAPSSWKEGEATEHFYSSKPPLLPTLIAGVLYPFRKATGVELGAIKTEPRYPRNVEKRVEVEPGTFTVEYVLETPTEPVKWPVYVYYFKPILFLFNVLPYGISLIVFARFLDRHAANDWAWFFTLFAASWGTYLFAFSQTLNNHTVAAWSVLFALYALVRIGADGSRRLIHFASAGFFSAFAACNELPAALFLVLASVLVYAIDFRRSLLVFLPMAAIPVIAFLATQFLAFGQFTPVYEEFGTKSYTYEGSYWNTPLEFDYLNVTPEPEPKYLYLLHMTFGHHGIFSLTPLVLLAMWGMFRNLFMRARRLRTVAWLTLLLTAGMLAFYTWNPKARNYGGSTQGLRWLFWLFPFWLFMLPSGVERGQDRRWARALCLVLLAISVVSAGYAMRHPWSHPWLVEMLERLGVYHLRR
jgi:hypothetical protein